MFQIHQSLHRRRSGRALLGTPRIEKRGKHSTADSENGLDWAAAIEVTSFFLLNVALAVVDEVAASGGLRFSLLGWYQAILGERFQHSEVHPKPTKAIPQVDLIESSRVPQLHRIPQLVPQLFGRIPQLGYIPKLRFRHWDSATRTSHHFASESGSNPHH